MRFTIVVPTYNEEHDIAATLDALVALDYDDKEILIVDDSNDRTPEIVERYKNRGVVLIHPGGGGRCEARNLGIQRATGEIVCILNADVRLPTDFLQRIKKHYEAGADYVLVSARVSNMDDLFARYVGCVGDAIYTTPESMEWTEGFSCRKSIALKAGLFPVGNPVPICAGEDKFFGEGLRSLGAKKVLDMSIVVEHVAPARLGEYWSIRKGRGAGSAQVRRYLEHWSMPRLFAWTALKDVRTALKLVTVVPVLRYCWAAARHSDRREKDVVPFMYAWTVEQLAFHVGEWQSIANIRRVEAKRAAAAANEASSGGQPRR
jgi:hypothetical protein